MKANIFDIKRNSFLDGPGIRTTVFFKGCNLKCDWCHSPESQKIEKEILFYKDRCIGCGNCKGLTADTENFICFNNAKEICGKEYTVSEVFEEISKDKIFYDTSNGGVTFSGGECMLQVEFLLEMLKECKDNGIHTAVDTAGNFLWESFDKIIPYTDLFLYDIKTMNNEKHKKYTGVENIIILQNLAKFIKSKISVWVRIPIIPDVNDNEEEMKNIKAFFDENGYPEKIEFLPYHAMGDHKYTALGRIASKYDVPHREKIRELEKMIALM